MRSLIYKLNHLKSTFYLEIEQLSKYTVIINYT